MTTALPGLAFLLVYAAAGVYVARREPMVGRLVRVVRAVKRLSDLRVTVYFL